MLETHLRHTGLQEWVKSPDWDKWMTPKGFVWYHHKSYCEVNNVHVIMSQLPWVSTVNMTSLDRLATDLIFCKTWQMSHVFDFSVHNVVIVCNWDWKPVHWSLEVAYCQWQIFHSVENIKSRKILLQKAVVLHRHLMHPGWSCCKHSEEHSLCLPLLCTAYMSFMWMSGPTWITKANKRKNMTTRMRRKGNRQNPRRDGFGWSSGNQQQHLETEFKH